MEKILIVYHLEAGIIKEMANAIKKGIEKSNNFEVIMKTAGQADQEDLKTASGIAIGTPDYFDYMAGSIKDFFDRTFYAVQSKIRGSLTADKPCVFFVSGGTGGEPALESLKKIGSYFKFNTIDYVNSGPRFTDDVQKKCELLGERLAKEVKKNKN